MTDYKVGDTITLEHPDGSRLIREVRATHRGPVITLAHSDWNERVSAMLADGWQITDVKSKPEPLPSELGYYLSADGKLWALQAGGWFEQDFGSWYWRDPETQMDVVKLSRLRPEVDVRREVLNELRALHHLPGTNAGAEYASRLERKWGLA